jgi:4-hydroxy-tetrahydrodipicolinate reductase
MGIMINGLPGNMATEAAKKIIEENFRIFHFSLTGPDTMNKNYEISGENFLLLKPDEKDMLFTTSFLGANSWPRSSEHPDVIAVDYTHPNAVNENAEFYCKKGLNFIMGTTGGDRKALEERVKSSDISAVIAPNMAKQIVAFQAMMEYAAKTFPNAFKGYSLEITESHQKGKADTSGTAKAMVDYFNSLGIPFNTNQISMIREPINQLAMGVPKEVLDGHGWHTYRLKSPDGNVLFQFTHNVNGRSIYADGTISAINFLSKKIKEGKKGQVYSMIDVLKEE